jgi:ketosteroid isomerase-like protein
VSGSGDAFAQRVRAMFAAIDSGRFAELPSYFAADCRYHRPGFAPVDGIDALLHFYREVRLIAAGAHRLERIICADDQAVVAGRFAGTLRDGRAADVGFCDVYQLDSSGRIRERTSYFYAPSV